MSAADLCVECGLCCTGELFSSVDLTADEATRLLARRLPVHDDGGRWKLPQPCPAHAGLCAVYADRPAACASFRCATLLAAEAGEIPLAEAARILVRAKALAASVRSRVRGSGALWRDIESLLQDTPAFRRDNADLLLDITLLREALRRIRHGRAPRAPAPA